MKKRRIMALITAAAMAMGLADLRQAQPATAPLRHHGKLALHTEALVTESGRSFTKIRGL